jgi:hypothetical protein
MDCPECPPGETCPEMPCVAGGFCIPPDPEGECVEDVDCPDGFRCESVWCAGDPSDPEGYWCLEGGVCVPTDPCVTDEDCPEGEVCAGVSCPEGGPCEASTCVAS